MKKLIAWIMMLCMVMGLLCGCSDDDSSSSRRSKRKDRDKEKETVEDRDDEDREDEDLDFEIIDDEDFEDDDWEIEEDKQETVKMDLVVYDENNIKVTVTGLTEGYSGKEIKFQLENNTEHNITLSGSTFVVNGITINGWLHASAAPGKKTNESIELYTQTLEDAGIQELATVSCVDAYVYDSDSYDTLFEGIQFGFENSIAADYQQKIDDSGEVIFQEAGVTVISKTISDDFMGKRILMLVKNDTGKDIIVEVDDAYIDGLTVDAWMYDVIMADTVRFCVLEIYSTTLEENGIETVDAVSFFLEARYVDSWDDICKSDELTISAN